MAQPAEDPGVSNNRILALAVRPLVVGTSDKLLNTLRLLCRGSRLAADAERRCVSISLPTEEPACLADDDGAEHPPSPAALRALLGRLPALAHVTVCQEPAHRTHSSTDAGSWWWCLSALQPAHLRSLELDGLALAPSGSGSNPVNTPAGAITPESLAALLLSAPGLHELALLRVTVLSPAIPRGIDPVAAPHAQHAEPGSTAGQRSTPAAQAPSPGAWCPILAALPSGLVSLRLSLSAATQDAAAECCGRASRGPRLAALGGAGAADGWARRAPPDATDCRWGHASPGCSSSGRPGATSSGSGMGSGGPAAGWGGCACSSAQPCPACLGVALRRLQRLTRLELSGLRAGGAVAALAAAVRPVAAGAGGGAQPQIHPPGRLGLLERLVLDLDGHVDMASMQGVVGCLPRLRHLALVEQAPLRGRRRPQRRPPHVHPPPPLPPSSAAGGPRDGFGGPGGSGDGPSGSPPGNGGGGGGGGLGSPSGGASAGERQPAKASGPAGNAAENGLGLHSSGLERSPTVSLNDQAEAGLESPSRSPGQLSPVSSSLPSSTSSTSSSSSSSSSSSFSSFGPPSFAALPVTPAEPPDEEQSDQDPVSYHPLGAVLWMLRRTDLRRLSFSSDRSFTTLEPPPLLLLAAPEPPLADPLLPPASHGPGTGSDAESDDGGGRWGHTAHGHTAAAAAAAAAASSSPHPSLSTPELPPGPPAEPLIPAPSPNLASCSSSAASPEPALASVRLSLRLSAEALEPLVACLPPSVASLTLVVGALHRPADVIAAYTAAADEAAAAAARAAEEEEAAARAEGEAAARAAATGGGGEGAEEAEGTRVAGGGEAAAGAVAMGAAGAGSQSQRAGGTGAGAGAPRASQGPGPGPGQRTPPPSLDAASPAWLSVPPLSFLGGVRFTWPALTQLPRVVPRLRELRLGGGAAAACGDHVLRCWAGASGDPDSLATPMVADPSFNAMLRVPAPQPQQPPPQQQRPGPGLGPADDAPPQVQPYRMGPTQAQARAYGHTHSGALHAPHGSPLGVGPASAAGQGPGQEPPEGLGLGGSEWARSLERVCLLAAGPTISACLHLRRFMGSLRRLQVVVDGRLTDVAVAVGGSE